MRYVPLQESVFSIGCDKLLKAELITITTKAFSLRACTKFLYIDIQQQELHFEISYDSNSKQAIVTTMKQIEPCQLESYFESTFSFEQKISHSGHLDPKGRRLFRFLSHSEQRIGATLIPTDDIPPTHLYTWARLFESRLT